MSLDCESPVGTLPVRRRSLRLVPNPAQEVLPPAVPVPPATAHATPLLDRHPVDLDYLAEETGEGPEGSPLAGMLIGLVLATLFWSGIFLLVCALV